MRRKITALAAALTAALALTAGASAKPGIHAMVDGDGGGTPSISVWIVAVYTYVDGYPQYLYCRYASDGQVVWQLDCWS